MKVTRLPKDPGPAGWNTLLDAPDPAIPLEGAVTTDWLVIGGGFAGLSAARQLSLHRPEDRIMVLDAIRIGDGPAGRNSGLMVDLPHDLSSDNYQGALDADRATTDDNRMAIAFAKALVEEFGLPSLAFQQTGRINAAATEHGLKHNADYAKHLTALGEPYEMRSADDLRELTGTTYYQGGLFTPHAATLQPAIYIRGFAGGLRSNRVTIHENSPVIALDQVGSDWVATTPKGKVTAPKVILAVNGHLNSFGFAKGRLMHIFTYASMTRAMTEAEVSALGGAPDWAVLPADPLGTTVRRISGPDGHRIVVRNRFTFDPELEVSDARIKNVARDHDRAFAARFPMLKGLDMEHRWGGRLCLSYNGVQLVDALADGLYSACCQNGLGTTRGTLAGILAANLACGHPSPALDRMLTTAEPRKLPPRPIAQIGAAIRLRWGERRAGREL